MQENNGSHSSNAVHLVDDGNRSGDKVQLDVIQNATCQQARSARHLCGKDGKLWETK